MRTSSVVHLPSAPASVGIARRALVSELRAAGVPDHAVHDAALVISELLSNAILHAYPLPGEQVHVTWSVDGEVVEVAVSDGGSPNVPHVSQPSATAIGGRGLAIVAHLCQAWGVRADAVGLTVWAVLATAQPNGPPWPAFGGARYRAARRSGSSSGDTALSIAIWETARGAAAGALRRGVATGRCGEGNWGGP